MNKQPVALITGSARRIGKVTAKKLHGSGFNIVVHCNNSYEEAMELVLSLNEVRPNSAKVIQGNIIEDNELIDIANKAIACFGSVSLLVNNASSFYPTPVEDSNLSQWNDLMGSNLKAPYFLSKYLFETLSQNNGCIINLVDIHADKPLKDYPIYCMAKAGLVMMTKSLAREFAPTIRVNGIAPGAILWPELEVEEEDKSNILSQIPLEKTGCPDDIASLVNYLATDATYITGQIIAVDGGRSLGGANKA